MYNALVLTPGIWQTTTAHSRIQQYLKHYLRADGRKILKTQRNEKVALLGLAFVIGSRLNLLSLASILLSSLKQPCLLLSKQAQIEH